MEIDYTAIIMALLLVFGAPIIREIRTFWVNFSSKKYEFPMVISDAANFGVKAAQTVKESGFWETEKGVRAEDYAVKTAQLYLDNSGVKINAALVIAAVKAAWQDSSFKN